MVLMMGGRKALRKGRGRRAARGGAAGHSCLGLSRVAGVGCAPIIPHGLSSWLCSPHGCARVRACTCASGCLHVRVAVQELGQNAHQGEPHPRMHRWAGATAHACVLGVWGVCVVRASSALSVCVGQLCKPAALVLKGVQVHPGPDRVCAPLQQGGTDAASMMYHLPPPCAAQVNTLLKPTLTQLCAHTHTYTSHN